jgi:uncharacterized membrane-anchored protein
MIKKTAVFLLCIFLLLPPFYAQEEESGDSILNQIDWEHGPTTGDLDGIAEIEIPVGYIFTDGDNSRVLMEAMGNSITDEEVGFFAPGDMSWYLIFEWDKCGYVKDDEKDELDADELLESIKEATERANQYRAQHGFQGLHVTGWETYPDYNEHTHNLEWATRAVTDGGETVINHNIRLLGRKGVMSATLVVEPDNLPIALADTHNYLEEYSFTPGNKYSEYKSGDKIAKYGLTALIVGGAAAVAAKSGLFKYIWKFLVFIVAGIVAFFKKIFGKRD